MSEIYGLETGLAQHEISENVKNLNRQYVKDQTQRWETHYAPKNQERLKNPQTAEANREFFTKKQQEIREKLAHVVVH